MGMSEGFPIFLNLLLNSTHQNSIINVLYFYIQDACFSKRQIKVCRID